MSVLKIFRCMDFNPKFDCPYTTTGLYHEVVTDGVAHEVTEHGETDNIKLHEEVRRVVEDAPPQTK